jgi:diguanylate cyclase (GGDEF)-like protein/PAS domain S-box-containing protein
MPAHSPDSPKQNRILAALTTKEYVRLADDFEPVTLVNGQVLYEPGDVADYVYFPTTCVVSRIFTTANGSSAELAMTGSEGMVGTSLILGSESVNYRVDVQSPGNAYRIKAEIMRWELDQGGELQRLSLSYIQALMAQMAQSIICNRHHSVDQQLCRWLLLALDRIPGNQIDITQERIASMLGVRREGITEAAGKLQAAGLIHYSRGHISVADRAGLEARACECYAAVKREQDRLQALAPEARVRNRVRPNPATLRRRAESRLLQAATPVPGDEWDSLRITHELQVHQIELEMQQEELKAAYGEVDALRERYADIYDFAPIGYVTIDQQAMILDLNLAGAILLGNKRSQKNRYRFTSSVSPEYVGTFTKFIDDVLKKRCQQRCEIALRPNAHRAGALVRIEAVPDESGQECRMVPIDISAEKKYEQKLSERDQYQRALLDNFPFNVWLKDEQGRFLAVNAPLATELGLPTADALVGKTDFDITSPERAAAIRAEDLAVIRTGGSTNVEQCREVNGEAHWFEVYKSAIAINGQHVGLVGFARDITERYVLQQALVDAERQQRNLMENLPLSVTIAQDGVLAYINPKALELCGYLEEECVGHSFLPLVFPEDHAKVMAEHEQRMRGEPARRDFDIRIVHKEGKIIDCSCSVRPVMWNKRIASLAIYEDVTERKRMMVELESVESTDLVTRLANRRHFLTRMEEELSRLHRDTTGQVAVLAIELDHSVESPLSADHSVNEAALRQFSGLLSAELRKADTAGRTGECEFGVLLPDTDLATAAVFADRLQKKFADAADAAKAEENGIALAVRIGVSAMRVADTRAEKSLARATAALNRSERGRRDPTQTQTQTTTDIASTQTVTVLRAPKKAPRTGSLNTPRNDAKQKCV